VRATASNTTDDAETKTSPAAAVEQYAQSLDSTASTPQERSRPSNGASGGSDSTSRSLLPKPHLADARRLA
jgi:hypothetical protein